MRYTAAMQSRFVLAAVLSLCTSCYGVTSTLTRHSTAEDFQKGETHGTVIGSEGTVMLGSETVQIWNAAQDEDIWAVNRIVAAPDGTIYAGTSPGGKILRCAGGRWTTIYPPEPRVDPNRPAAEPNAPQDPNAAASKEEPRPSEHVFALALDRSGRLIAGISGRKCMLVRFENETAVTVFEPNDARYIFAIAVDNQDNMYLATGPKGRLYKVAPGGTAQVLCTIKEKNILSLALGTDDVIYAGSDEKGRIYSLDVRTGRLRVLYDADEAEVAALALAEDGALYAAVSSEQAIRTTGVGPAGVTGTQPGRMPLQIARGQNTAQELRIAQLPAQEQVLQDKAAPKPAKPAKPATPSVIYRVTKEGYVTKLFAQPVAFFDMTLVGNRLIVGTGNAAQLFAIDIKTEEQCELYADKKASQITAVCAAGSEILAGTANTARISRILAKYASEATFDSALVDAGQPATWGKLHIEATIPAGTGVMMSARSGNVSEANDPTFTPWTRPVPVNGPVSLECPVGRFCQYRLILKSDGKDTPVVREVALASVVANLAPVVEAVTVAAPPASAQKKEGVLKVAVKAHDDNKDTLTYKIEMRKLGRQKWIKIEDDLEKNEYEWDSRKVEDGRYELRVTASDRKSNTEATALTDERISEPVVVDNTPPQVINAGLSVYAGSMSMVLKFAAVDELSVIAGAEYAIDSNKNWAGTLPDDAVFDEINESFTIVAKDLTAGEHVIAVRITDAAGNTIYKSWDFMVSQDRQNAETLVQ
jgi:hypothetical protein